MAIMQNTRYHDALADVSRGEWDGIQEGLNYKAVHGIDDTKWFIEELNAQNPSPQAYTWGYLAGFSKSLTCN